MGKLTGEGEISGVESRGDEPQQSVAVFEGIPDGTLTLRRHLAADPAADGFSPEQVLTFPELLDVLDKLVEVCEDLASDRDPTEGTAILWDPTQVLKPRNILMFPKRKINSESPLAHGYGANRFAPKCLPHKLGCIKPTSEKEYFKIIGELICDCLFGTSLGTVKEWNLEGELVFRPVLNTTGFDGTVAGLRAFVLGYFPAGAGPETVKWEELRDLRSELQAVVATAWKEYGNGIGGLVEYNG